MKHVAIYLCILAFVFCLSYEFDGMGKCSRCREYEEIAGNCPCCDATLCASCLSGTEDQLHDQYELDHEHGYEEGYEDGYEDGYFEGCSVGSEDGYQEGYSDGYSDGSTK